jgi:hypothetical protein
MSSPPETERPYYVRRSRLVSASIVGAIHALSPGKTETQFRPKEESANATKDGLKPFRLISASRNNAVDTTSVLRACCDEKAFESDGFVSSRL